MQGDKFKRENVNFCCVPDLRCEGDAGATFLHLACTYTPRYIHIQRKKETTFFRVFAVFAVMTTKNSLSPPSLLQKFVNLNDTL